MLPNKIHHDESMTINLQDYFQGNGTHWFVMYNDKNSDVVEYFDSFELMPPIECKQYMKTCRKDIVNNSSQIHNIDSIMCCYYCCYHSTIYG